MTPARYQVSAQVAWVDAETIGQEGTTVYVAPAANLPPVVLDGTAWAIWSSVADGGTLDEITGRTAERTGNDPAAIADDVAAFVESLVDRGLLARQPGDLTT